ncbi:Allophanate hydrolase 2 subunit 1 [hydrothermal vent metagenome]|uniref:Allophanate hydrolase 2 subunit 1 n=1 Tax=hydrothermal vent metagenome TaxID=652676 RepID=A0A3B0V323_9ZZZZ
MSTFKLTYKPFGESAILIEWPQKISIAILDDIRNFSLKIKHSRIKYILEINFVYSSLLVIYKSKKINYFDLKKELQFIYNKNLIIKNNLKKNIWEIPVCYDIEFGIDLPFLSLQNKISIEEIISIHSSNYYTVYGIGFLPGFLYLGGLSKKLYLKRRETPRLEVPKGSVAVGGKQTGIYPVISPGGWHIIGKTPISIFNINNKEACLVIPGDKVKFNPISKEEFDQIISEKEVKLKKVD